MRVSMAPTSLDVARVRGAASAALQDESVFFSSSGAFVADGPSTRVLAVELEQRRASLFTPRYRVHHFVHVWIVAHVGCRSCSQLSGFAPGVVRRPAAAKEQRGTSRLQAAHSRCNVSAPPVDARSSSSIAVVSRSPPARPSASAIRMDRRIRGSRARTPSSRRRGLLVNQGAPSAARRECRQVDRLKYRSALNVTEEQTEVRRILDAADRSTHFTRCRACSFNSCSPSGVASTSLANRLVDGPRHRRVLVTGTCSLATTASIQRPPTSRLAGSCGRQGVPTLERSRSAARRGTCPDGA